MLCSTCHVESQWRKTEDGSVIVGDAKNNRIRKITPRGHVPTLAGTGERGYLDGEGVIAQFYFPAGVAENGDGNVIVADTGNQRVRKITPQVHVCTLTGSGEWSSCCSRSGSCTCRSTSSSSSSRSSSGSSAERVPRFTSKTLPAWPSRPSSSTFTQITWRWMTRRS
jgi:hypothetical protein